LNELLPEEEEEEEEEDTPKVVASLKLRNPKGLGC
jgi:hypothetical protein